MARSKKPSDQEILDAEVSEVEDAVVSEAEVESVENAAPHDEAEQAVDAVKTDEEISVASGEVTPIETAALSQTKKPGPIPMLLAGVVTAAVGFGTAQYLGNDRWPFQSGPSAADELAVVVELQRSEIEALQATLAEVSGQFAAVASKGDVDALRADQEATTQNIVAATSQIGTIDQRLVDLENRPIPDVGATAQAVATYERELEAMRQMFQTELERIEFEQVEAIKTGSDAAQNAENAEKGALAQRLKSAVDGGDDAAPILADLADRGVNVPDELSRAADIGIATLGQLQSEFPEVARAALNATIRAQAAAGETNRISAFLLTQLGARSLNPKSGDDPDAILSRAEASLREGNLDAVLIELQSMPEVAGAELSKWVEAATNRQNALSGVAALTDEIKG